VDGINVSEDPLGQKLLTLKLRNVGTYIVTKLHGGTSQMTIILNEKQQKGEENYINRRIIIQVYILQ
jgi:hypothetical protein